MKYAFDFQEKDSKVRDLMQSRLELCFAMVANPDDVRGPIDAWIPFNPELVDAVRDAVVHFVGEQPTMTRVGNKVRVESDGYRNGPCGP